MEARWEIKVERKQKVWKDEIVKYLCVCLCTTESVGSINESGKAIVTSWGSIELLSWKERIKWVWCRDDGYN